MNGLAGCYVSTIGKPHEYFDLTGIEKAAQVCRRFNHRRIAGFAAEELQADEIRTFAGKKTPSWVFVTIEGRRRLRGCRLL